MGIRIQFSLHIAHFFFEGECFSISLSNELQVHEEPHLALT